jgi:hypothetical protein
MAFVAAVDYFNIKAAFMRFKPALNAGINFVFLERGEVGR